MMKNSSTATKSSKAVKYLEIARSIIMEHIPNDEFAVFLFGSRAKEKDLRYSDLDIGIFGEKELPLRIKAELEETLNESIVPFDVELVDFQHVSERFTKEALQNIEVWNDPKNLMKSLQH